MWATGTFLLGGAMSLRLPGFDANNLIDGKNQITDIAIDGKESQIEAFKEFVQINRPPGAEVSSISISDYDGDVMKMAEYAQVLTLSYCSRQIFRKIIKNF